MCEIEVPSRTALRATALRGPSRERLRYKDYLFDYFLVVLVGGRILFTILYFPSPFTSFAIFAPALYYHYKKHYHYYSNIITVLGIQFQGHMDIIDTNTKYK